MNKNEKTIFEKIVSGEIPSDKIYENDSTFAFLDINPLSPGHTLLITKKPYENLLETPTEEAGALIKPLQKISKAVKKATGADGVKIVSNNGESAGQIVFHTHIHIIPKFKEKKYQGYEYKEGEADEIKKKIVKFL